MCKIYKYFRDKYMWVYIDIEMKIEVWGSNFIFEDLIVDVVFKVWDVIIGELMFEKKIVEGLVLLENRLMEVGVLDVLVREKGKGEENKIVVMVYIVQNGK